MPDMWQDAEAFAHYQGEGRDDDPPDVLPVDDDPDIFDEDEREPPDDADEYHDWMRDTDWIGLDD